MILKITELAEALKTLPFPIAYRMFKKKTEPPFLVYYRNSSENVAADNSVYCPRENYIIEFYSRNKDMAAEKLIGDILTEKEIFFEIDETYIDDENIYETIFEFQI